jgi:hypothetical protein
MPVWGLFHLAGKQLFVRRAALWTQKLRDWGLLPMEGKFTRYSQNLKILKTSL